MSHESMQKYTNKRHFPSYLSVYLKKKIQIGLNQKE